MFSSYVALSTFAVHNFSWISNSQHTKVEKLAPILSWWFWRTSMTCWEQFESLTKHLNYINSFLVFTRMAVLFLDNRTIIFLNNLMHRIRQVLFNLWRMQILKEVCFEGTQYTTLKLTPFLITLFLSLLFQEDMRFI